MKVKKVIVVVPTYNEHDNIGPLVDRISAVRSALGAELRILFVDDGSPDATVTEIEKLAKANEFVGLLERGTKKGLGTAYQEGFRRAIADYDPDAFVQMDADLQHPPEALGALVRAIGDGADVAVGSRYVRGGGFKEMSRWRRLVSNVANRLARLVLGLGVRDATSGFKALNRRAVDAILGVELYSKGFIFQVESLFVFKRRGLKAVEVPYVFEVRWKGASKMSASEMWEFLRSVFAIRSRDY